MEKNYFQENLAQLPSDEIKTIVNHLHDFNYDDLFENFGETKENDKKSFYRRINDLVQAFRVDQNTESIGDIIGPIFKKHFDIISKAEEDLVDPNSFFGKEIARKKKKIKSMQSAMLGIATGAFIGSIFYFILRKMKNINTK